MGIANWETECRKNDEELGEDGPESYPELTMKEAELIWEPKGG
jgi:hypothetical protein